MYKAAKANDVQQLQVTTLLLCMSGFKMRFTIVFPQALNSPLSGALQDFILRTRGGDKEKLVRSRELEYEDVYGHTPVMVASARGNYATVELVSLAFLLFVL